MKSSRITFGLFWFCVLVGILWWHMSRPQTVVREPRAVMGTNCRLVAVVPGYRVGQADAWLRQSEETLRQLESKMSTWIDASEISRLNAAPAGGEMNISPETLEVLRAAREAYDRTGGVFDVTCRPLVLLWRTAGQSGQMPTDEEITTAREASSWDQILVNEDGTVVKLRDSCCVDLGGIAKGLAIDKAVEAIEQSSLVGGLVDVGGDLRLLGTDTGGRPWIAAVKNPFDEGVLLEIEVGPQAVCTSGDYARGIELDGKHLSHIIDPRTGRPAKAAASVTVVAPTALEADIWATALSVLGPEGLAELPDGVEALLVVRTEGAMRLLATPGMKARIRGTLPEGAELVVRPPNEP